MNQVNKQIKTKKNQQGFTLMEVMVVIVIIGMIGGAVVQNVMGSLLNTQLPTHRHVATRGGATGLGARREG